MTHDSRTADDRPPHHEHPHDHPHGVHGHRASSQAEPSPATQRAFVPDESRVSQGERERLVEGCGKGGILFLDASSGIAGDMTVAALLHLGVPLAVVQRAIDALGVSGFRLTAQYGRLGAISACKFDVEVTEAQPERHYSEIIALLRASQLPSSTVELATAVFRRLGEAEARVHGIDLEKVHFHEVGALDSIVDVVGAVAAVEFLGAELITTPLPLGHGFVRCRHGIMPLPAPATVECLRDVPTYAANLEAETVTPTGAALVGTLCRRFARWPEMSPQRVGWGAGGQVFDDRPNVLRAVLGRPCATSGIDAGGHVVLEANVDDMTGELTGHVLALLMQAGALDAWAVPVTMKKGRPAVVLSAIVAPEDSARLSELMLRETTTLGVRRTETGRIERPRRMIEVMTRFGMVQIKVSQGPYGPMQIKPEFDDCARIAKAHETPVREVIAEAMCRARAELLGT